MPERTVSRSFRSAFGVAIALAAIKVGLLTAATDGRASDLELGRYLAAECMTCHRNVTAAIPNIFGMPEARFAVLIKAYREKQLPNPVMQNIASRLKDDEIEALGAYFSQATRP